MMWVPIVLEELAPPMGSDRPTGGMGHYIVSTRGKRFSLPIGRKELARVIAEVTGKPLNVYIQYDSWYTALSILRGPVEKECPWASRPPDRWTNT